MVAARAVPSAKYSTPPTQPRGSTSSGARATACAASSTRAGRPTSVASPARRCRSAIAFVRGRDLQPADAVKSGQALVLELATGTSPSTPTKPGACPVEPGSRPRGLRSSTVTAASSPSSKRLPTPPRRSRHLRSDLSTHPLSQADSQPLRNDVPQHDPCCGTSLAERRRRRALQCWFLLGGSPLMAMNVRENGLVEGSLRLVSWGHGSGPRAPSEGSSW